MSVDSIYSDDWNSCLTEPQINTWNLEDDINRIGSKAEDFLSGIWGVENSPSETNSRRKTYFNQDSSNPFRQFQTPPSGRTSPTPLADLYSQSIYQAEVNSDSWQAPENCNHIENRTESTEEENGVPCMKGVDCMPQDLFSFSQQMAEHAEKIEETLTETQTVLPEYVEKLNRSLTESENISSVKKEVPTLTEEPSEVPTLTEEPSEVPTLTEEPSDNSAPQLLAHTTKESSASSAKRPLLSLSIGMSICGVGLVFGAQIMHNSTVVNPGKSLIIAGLIGLFVSVVLQTFSWFGKSRTV